MVRIGRHYQGNKALEKVRAKKRKKMGSQSQAHFSVISNRPKLDFQGGTLAILIYSTRPVTIPASYSTITKLVISLVGPGVALFHEV
jgi:hypothetical protein